MKSLRWIVPAIIVAGALGPRGAPGAIPRMEHSVTQYEAASLTFSLLSSHTGRDGSAPAWYILGDPVKPVDVAERLSKMPKPVRCSLQRSGSGARVDCAPAEQQGGDGRELWNRAGAAMIQRTVLDAGADSLILVHGSAFAVRLRGMDLARWAEEYVILPMPSLVREDLGADGTPPQPSLGMYLDEDGPGFGVELGE